MLELSEYPTYLKHNIQLQKCVTKMNPYPPSGGGISFMRNYYRDFCYLLNHRSTKHLKWIERTCKTGEGSSEIVEGATLLSHNVHEISFFADSFLFAAMWAKNVLLPTPAISQTSTAVLSEFSYKILAFSNFAGSVLGLSPDFPLALADERPAGAFEQKDTVTYLIIWNKCQFKTSFLEISFDFLKLLFLIDRQI